jgi:hypothetical protein
MCHSPVTNKNYDIPRNPYKNQTIANKRPRVYLPTIQKLGNHKFNHDMHIPAGCWKEKKNIIDTNTISCWLLKEKKNHYCHKHISCWLLKEKKNHVDRDPQAAGSITNQQNTVRQCIFLYSYSSLIPIPFYYSKIFV